MARNVLFLLTAVLLPAQGLQVTPNSPCSNVCIDASDLDASDPNSSNTHGRDIVCPDTQFESKTNGKKFKNCMTCLQNSTYTQGSESDQAWFLYNLRYAFDYCIFGYPNATGIGSNPCLTPEACGRLGTALKDGITTPDKVQRLQYCDIDGGVLTGTYYESCLQCVQADGQHAYLSNFLIALEAGCKQKPPATTPIGLNETIFTSHTVQIVEPSAQSAPSPSLVLSTAAIAGIAIGSVVFLALLSGCTYMQIRKRRNKLDRSRRTLSFRCKTAAATSQPVYTDDYDDERFFEKSESQVSAVSMSPVARSKPVPWEAHGRQLNISTGLPCPEAAYTSPRMGGFSPDDFTPPTSTVSTRSNAPLLRGGFPSPGMGSGGFGRPSAVVSQDARIRSDFAVGVAVGDGRKGRGTPRSPVRITRIQTTFDPPPTK